MAANIRRVLYQHHLPLSRLSGEKQIVRMEEALTVYKRKIVLVTVYSNSVLAFVEILGSKLQRLTKGFERRDLQKAGKKMTIYLDCILCLIISSATALLIGQVPINSSLTIFENRCMLRPSPFSHVPSYYDCLHAIDRLPTRPEHEWGPFHNGPPEDPYQLPVTKVHETCSVRVELLAGGTVFRESWAGVKGAAWLLDSICLKTVSMVGQLHAGGWTTWGDRSRIVIVLAYPFEKEGDEVGGRNVTDQ